MNTQREEISGRYDWAKLAAGAGKIVCATTMFDERGA